MRERFFACDQADYEALAKAFARFERDHMAAPSPNPEGLEKRAREEGGDEGFYAKPEHGWTCFHCGETFATVGAARDHFGFEPSSDPACRIKVGAERGLIMALRKAEKELADYVHLLHDENLEAYRLLASARSQHGDQLQTAEELGYERGLADGRAEAAALSVPEVAQGEADALIVGLRERIAGVVEFQGHGFWTTCSGCYESEDGYPNGYYPHSEVLGCTLGAGCSECGGIGAVWDDIDYDEMAREMLAEDREAAAIRSLGSNRGGEGK